MDVIHQRVAGLDVHKETIVACVRIMVDARVSRECRTFDTTTAGLKDLLAWLTASGCSHVAMEATGVYWKPVWNILSDGTFEVLVACGLIRGSFVPDQAFQELRTLLRTRKQLTREQADVRGLLSNGQDLGTGNGEPMPSASPDLLMRTYPINCSRPSTR